MIEAHSHLTGTPFYYEYGVYMSVRSKVVSGPQSVMDRIVKVHMSFTDIEELYKQMQEARKRHDADTARTAKINADNQGGEK